MHTEIFYFSGTGNSLWVAKTLSGCLSADLASISSTIDQTMVHTASNTLCLVFPAYLAQRYGLPGIVEDFIRKIPTLNEKTVFAVCTCGGWELVNALPTLKRLNRVLKNLGGNHLFGAYSVKLPMNNLSYPSPLINQDQGIMVRRAEEKTKAICDRILRAKPEPYKWLKSAFNLLMKPLYVSIQNLYVRHLRKMASITKPTKLGYFDLIRHSDRSIQFFEDRCIGCSICAQICPAKNIQMVDGKPMWIHRCEMCLACDEWCPQKAIHHWCKTLGKDYHHPQIDRTDMIEQAKPRKER